MSINDKQTIDTQKAEPNIQGEGDRASDRKYRDDTKQFLDSADVSELARRAAPQSKEEAAKLKQAEEAGRSHAVGGKGAESWPKDKSGH